MLLLKRTRHRAIVFAALFVVVGLVSGVSIGILGYLGAAEVDGVRAQLAQRSGADVALELSLTTEPDVPAQDARAKALLGRVFSDGDRMLGLTVTRSSVSTNPVQLSTGVKAFAASIPDLEANADLVDGSWPSSPGEASVQADAAAALGLAPGDTLDVGDTTVTVTGTWRVTDELDPRWVSDGLFLDGVNGAIFGPIVLGEDELPTVGAETRTRWAIAPVIGELRTGDLQLIIDRWRTIVDSMRADGGFDVNGVQLNGRFASTATSTQATVDALSAVIPVVLLVIAAIVALALVELGRLLATLRAGESLLLWSRGDTVAALTRATAAEAAVVAVVGAAAGTGVGIAVLGQDPELLGSAVWVVPAVAAAAAILAFGGTALLAVRSVARREAAEEGGRASRVTGIAAPVLLTLAAVVSTWQLLLYGSPLTPARDGGMQVDPIAVVAPALVLLALVTLALAALPLLGKPLDARARAATGLGLVPRALARRTGLLAAPFVLCALAVGQLTVAAGYAQTWDSAYTTTSALHTGSEVTATGTRTDIDESVVATIAGAAGVTEVAPVYSEQVVVGETPAGMVAATPAALVNLATAAGGVFDAPAAAALITTPLARPELPSGTREVTATIEANSDVPVRLRILVADELGVQHDVAMTDLYRAELPEGRGDWKVLAFIVDLEEGGATSVRVTGLAADGADIPIGDNWTATGFSPLLSEVEPAPTGAGFRSADGLTSVRVGPTLEGIRPPVVISAALAAQGRIRVGDVVPIALDARLAPSPCLVVAIVPAIPGALSESAVLVDGNGVAAARARLYNETPAPQVAWVGSTEPAATFAALSDSVPAGVVIRSLAVDANRGILASAATALWIGAGGAGILAVVALIAVVGAQLRSRRPEIAVLRALGVSDRALARARQAEIGIVLALGAVVGLVSGAVVTVLTIPALARAAVPGSFASLATTVGVQPLALALGVGALGAAFAVVLAVYGRRVTR
ncbi:hypothetical protein BH11ACT5_BH11ACT5_28010 [soil metagenome]